MGKHTEILVPIAFVLIGVALLAGEWFCVEILWKCVVNKSAVISVGMVFIMVGLLLLLAIIEDRRCPDQ